jgi:hypothetical protein
MEHKFFEQKGEDMVAKGHGIEADLGLEEEAEDDKDKNIDPEKNNVVLKGDDLNHGAEVIAEAE